MRLPLFAFVWLGFAALASAQDNAQIKIGGGTIDISFDTTPTEDLRKLVIDWIATAAGRRPPRALRMTGR